MDHMSTEAVVVLISHPHMVDVERMFLMLVLTKDKSIMNISTCCNSKATSLHVSLLVFTNLQETDAMHEQCVKYF